MALSKYIPAVAATAALLGSGSHIYGGQGSAAAESAQGERLVLIPFVPGEARVLTTAEVAVMAYNPDDGREPALLERLEVLCRGDVLHSEELGVRLHGDPRYGELNALVERLPRELTELHRERNYFAAPDAAPIPPEEVVQTRHDVATLWSELEDEYAHGLPQPFVQLDFPLHYDQLFFPEEPAGTRRELDFRLHWLSADGRSLVASTKRTVTRLAPPLQAPAGMAAFGSATTLHVGDLHVHSCHGEAANACAPSTNCTAESFQTSGSFSYAQLKSQYQLLGMDWFTATDHSYCINSDGEYQVIVAECAAVTDAAFLCMPDIELSSDESGPQVGSDLGNALCLGTTSANHMGAHDITQRLEGGGDGFLGFCNGLFSDVLEPFRDNIASIRAQGGYPIANHPDASSYGWNSHEHTHGIEANGVQGVEIWNEASQSGQGGNVGRWVDWLLDGRVMYAYSGSDTHDEAFVFGANHVLLDGEDFTIPNVHAALKAGRSFVSNEHVLILEVELGGLPIGMGARHSVPAAAPAAPLTPRVYYDFGADSAVITFFGGKVGDAGESVLCTSGPLTGQGSFECAAVLETGASSWIRAYSESGSKTAYTNPVFFMPSTDDPLVYCLAKPVSYGCLPAIAHSGTASATSPAVFDISATQVPNDAFGILFYGYTPDFAPFQDGTLCVAPPLVRTPIQNSGGSPAGQDCTGSFHFDFNAHAQSGFDPALVVGAWVHAQYWFRDPGAASGTGFSDAVRFSIGL